MTEPGEPHRVVATTIDARPHDTGRSTSTPNDEVVPDEVGRYRISSMLGSGGMGVVYRAHDPELDRDVALKLIRTSWRGLSATARDRSLREAQALAKLTHANVVRVYDVGIADGNVFIAMEFLRGRTLSEIREPRLPWRATLDRYLAAGEGLAAAHAQNLVHRDFKPENVMLTDAGEIKVLDFGLATLAAGDSGASEEAKPTSDDGSREPGDARDEAIHDAAASHSAFDLALTTPGTFLGTPAYMAPEQFDGRAADARSDQFSFCVALWLGIYGERPYTGDTIHKLRGAIRRGRIATPKTTDAPPALRKVLEVGLSADPAKRHASMRALLDALRQLQRGQRGWAMLLAAAVAFAVGITVFTATSPEPPCMGARVALGSTWDDARREAIQAVILESGHGYADATWQHLRPRLDAWAEAWVESHEAICRASKIEGSQSPQDLDARMACLERARSSLDAFFTVLEERSESAVPRSVRSAARLPSPAACQGAHGDSRVASLPPAVQQRLSQIRKRLDEAVANAEAGDRNNALQLALAVAAEARELGATSLRIDAMLLEAEQRGTGGERHAAEATLREAYLLAVEADDALRAANAARNLVFVTGVDLAHYDEALEWHRHARAQLDRLPNPDPLAEAALLGNLGAVQGNVGDFAASTKSQRQALELERSVYGPNALYMVPTYANLANALVNEGRYLEAIGFSRDAVRLAGDNLGEEHPDLVGLLEGLATALRLSGDCQAATATTQRALGIARTSFGAEHIATGRNLLALAACDTDPTTASSTAATALKIHRDQLGDAHPDLVAAIDTVSGMALRAERFTDAVPLLKEAVTVQERIGGPNHPDIADHLTNLGTALRRLGRLDEAIDAYGRAAKIFAETPNADAEPLLHLNRALALHDAERWSEATAAYVTAMETLAEAGQHESLMHMQAQSGHGEVLRRLGRPVEALPVLRRAHDRLRSHPDADATAQWRTVRAHAALRLATALVAAQGGRTDETTELAEAARRAFDGLGDAAGKSAAAALLAK